MGVMLSKGQGASAGSLHCDSQMQCRSLCVQVSALLGVRAASPGETFSWVCFLEVKLSSNSCVTTLL